MAVIEPSESPTHLSDVLKLVASSGHHYPILHFVSCRVCQPAAAKPATPPAERLRTEGTQTITQPLASWQARPGPDASQDKYDARIIVQHGTEPQAVEAAAKLFGKHSNNSVVMLQREDSTWQLLRAGGAPPAGRVKIQVVGQGNTYRREPLLGGSNAHELSQGIRSLMKTLDIAPEGLAKVTVRDCSTGNCAGESLLERLQNELDLWPTNTRPLLKGHRHPVAIDDAGHVTPVQPNPPSTPDHARSVPERASPRPDPYDHRIIIRLEDDAQASTAAQRLFNKHADNSLLLQADSDGEWQFNAGALPQPGSHAKVQFVGHGGWEEGTPRLGGLKARYLATLTQSLLPMLGDDGQIRKVALVGCDSGGCPQWDMASQLRLYLLNLEPVPQISGYQGRIDVDPQGHKIRVDHGGLGNLFSRSRVTPDAESPTPAATPAVPERVIRRDSKAALSESADARQLIIFAHGNVDTALEHAPFEQRHVQVPAGSRMDFYSFEGQASRVLPRQLIVDYPSLGEMGMPGLAVHSREHYRERALRKQLSFDQVIKEELRVSRRKETRPAGALVKNYELSPVTLTHGDIALFNRTTPANDVDMAVAQRSDPPVHLSDILNLVASTGHSYPILHFVACRVCEPETVLPEGARAEQLRTAGAQPIAQPLASWQARPGPDPALDKYDSRIIVQHGNDPFTVDAAAKLFGKHPGNSVVMLERTDASWHLLRAGGAPPAGRVKIQVVGQGSKFRGDPLLGGSDAQELSQGLRTLMQTLDIAPENLVKLAVRDCNTRSCATEGLLERLRDEVKAWPAGTRPRLTGHRQPVEIDDDGHVRPVPQVAPLAMADASSDSNRNSPDPDRYDHRIIIQLAPDPQTDRAAQRLFAKHAGNSMLLQTDHRGQWRVKAGDLPTPGSHAKVQFVGHGRWEGGAPLLGGMEAGYLSMLTKGLLPLLGEDGQLGKVALVGCDSGGCPGFDMASQLQPMLADLQPAPQIKGYRGRIDVDPAGHKTPVDEGGLGRRQPRRVLHRNDTAAFSESQHAQQLIVYAHGSADPDLNNAPLERSHVRVPVGSRMDFYSLEGQPTRSLPRFLIAEHPRLAQIGMPGIAIYGNAGYRRRALEKHLSFDQVIRQEREAARRKESRPAGALVKNYALSPVAARSGDIEYFNRYEPTNGVDLAVVVRDDPTPHLSDILKLVKTSGHQYKTIHFVACRDCEPTIRPPSAAQMLRTLGTQTLAAPLTSWQANPGPDPSQDRYDSRIIVQHGTDPETVDAAAKLFGKHPGNSIVMLEDADMRWQLVRAGERPPAGRTKIQLVGQGSLFRGEPLLGGSNALELSQSIRSLIKRLDVDPRRMVRLTVRDCNSANCATQALLDRLQDELDGWRSSVRPLLKGHPQPVQIDDHGHVTPIQRARPPVVDRMLPSAPRTGSSLDRYGHRIIVPLEAQTHTQAAAQRLFNKHAANSMLLEVDTQGPWRIAAGKAPAPGSHAKVQFVGHGSREQGTPLLGGMKASYIAAFTQGLLPLLGDEGRISKVALVGCDSGGCPGRDLASRLHPLLADLQPAPQISGYRGRIDVDPAGHKVPVIAGGLGKASKPRRSASADADAQHGQRVIHRNGNVALSASAQAQQLIIFAHGNADRALKHAPFERSHVQIPAGSRMDFYSHEGQSTTALPRFLIPDYPNLAKDGMPGVALRKREDYRLRALANGVSFEAYLDVERQAARRKETRPAGAYVKNYRLGAVLNASGDIERFNRRTLSQEVDMAVVENQGSYAHLSDVLKLVASTGHSYPVMHFVACRLCKPIRSQSPARRAHLLRTEGGQPLSRPLADWQTRPGPDPSQDRYDSRIILQHGTDPETVDAAAKLFGKHAGNSIVMLQHRHSQWQLMRAGGPPPAGRIKVQLVGQGSLFRAEPLLGGYNAPELSKDLRLLLRQLEISTKDLAKLTVRDCNTSSCASGDLLDNLEEELKRWPAKARPQLNGHRQPVQINDKGKVLPIDPSTDQSPLPAATPSTSEHLTS